MSYNLMPEKISLSGSIMKTAGLLAVFTAAVSLVVVIYIYLSSGSEKELLHLSGGDYLVALGLWLSVGSLLFGLLALSSASGLARRQNWARITTFLTAVILTLLIPIGTIFGLKLLFNFFSREMKNWFSPGGEKTTRGIPPAQKRGLKSELP
ncbi:MAG TPA: hypothetical protein DCW97_07515 [Acidobacteria bacterium]|nr:hypothetical protein [Acidobacteriota bacterium]